MKKIALILAVVMLFSAVSVFAAPSVVHVLYDETEKSYFVFGRYLNSVANNRDITAVDAGIYLNGEKYTYAKEGAVNSEDIPVLDVANGMEVPKFAMKFKAPADYFEKFNIQPYIVNSIGEKRGDVYNFDYSNGERVKSSDATLKYVAIERVRGNSYYLMTPAFSPSHEDYTLAGKIDNSATTTTGYGSASLKVKYIKSDSRAEVEVVDATAQNGKIYINVLAEDKESKKTYTFSLVNKYAVSSSAVSASDCASVYYQGESTTTGVSALNGNKQLDIVDWAASDDYKSIIMRFPINETMANADAIALTFTGGWGSNTTPDYKNIEIAAKKVNIADGYTLKPGETCYKDVIEKK